MNQTPILDVLIVGAGLAGLQAALVCQRAGLSLAVFEAADRVGGRIHSVFSSDVQSSPTSVANAQYLADLGPTWVWPPYQANVQRALSELPLQLMPQFEQGLAVVERPGDGPAEHHPLPGQHGMSRLSGGPQSIINAHIDALPEGTVFLNHQVVGMSDKGSHVEVSLKTAEQPLTIQAKAVVVTTPLRVADEQLQFTPALPSEMQSVLRTAPTWMATQAKAVLVYQHAFWRDAGLSGRVASQLGPLVEVHDHSGADGKPAALFGFLGVPAQAREAHRAQLHDAIVAQMVRCFGEQAANPLRFVIEDWALNRFVCAQADSEGVPQHPAVLPEKIREATWGGRLQFAVAETATASPGLIDGALEAGSRAANLLVNQFKSTG